MADSKGAIYEFDNFRLEAAERLLTRDGQPVELSSKAFDLLLALVENSGRLVEKEKLYSRVWAGSIVEDSNLTVQMSAIRKALGDHSYIQTVKGHGYRFLADVRRLNGKPDEYTLESTTFSRVTVEHETEDAVARVTQTPQPASRRRALPFVLAGLSLAVLLGIGGYVWRSGILTERRSAVEEFRSGSIKRLTSTGKVASASAISPDGRLFVYSQYEGELQSLWLGHTDGGESRQIRPPAEVTYTSARFTPDGSRLYYTLSESGLYRMPVFGGVPEIVSSKVRQVFSFSPDGQRFAFIRGGREGTPAVVIATAGGHEENAIGIPPTTLGFRVTSPAWSPDGSAIAVGAPVNDSGAAYQVFVVKVNDGSLERVTSENFSLIDTISWLNDGMVAVSSGTLWHIAYPDGKSQRLLNDLSLYGLSLGLSDSGNELLTVQTDQYSNIWIAPAGDLAEAKQITFGSLSRADGWSGLDWTWEGKIVYTAVVDGNQTIWSMNADGTGQTQLTPTGQRNFHPSIADDGSTIVFSSVQGGKYSVWRMNPDGSGIRQVTDTDIAAQPHISPDGRWIVYVANRESLGKLYRIPAEGGEPVQLTGKEMSWVRVSPDSKYVAGAYRDDGGTKLAIVPIEGGDPIRLFNIPRLANFRLGVRWSPDGKFIAYRDWANGIWKQNTDGGDPERIAGLPEEKIYSFGWSRDSKQFAYVRGQEIRDVVLLTRANR